MSLIIPQTDPKASYIAYKHEIDAVIDQVMESGWYILGQQVAKCEQEFAAYIGVSDAIGVGSGTDALHLALKSCDIGIGDVVITVSHTAVATVAAIELASAIPALVDIEPETFTMDPNLLEDAVKEIRSGKRSDVRGHLKAIIPVHLYGHPADMSAIMGIARRYDLFVIEDCAQSHGAAISSQKTGTWGHLSAFSFYPTKNLGTFGDGGVVVTDNSVLAEKARLLREYGWRKRYISEIPGMNTRLDELQAAILRVKLRYLKENNARRRAIARMYDDLLSTTSLKSPKVRQNAEHVYHQYVVRSSSRDELRAFLKANDISTAIHYPVPVHSQPAYNGRALIVGGDMQNTEITCKEIVSLPMYPQMSDKQVQRVCSVIADWERQNKVK